jgi:hypothetical protein
MWLSCTPARRLRGGVERAGLLRVAGATGLAAILLWAAPAPAGTWQGQLERGGAITVDPQTHRAIREDGGGARPMWDGVHRLEDGSTVIIRDGIAVPTEDMVRTWTDEGRPQPVFERRYCNQLVRKTCGFDNACNSSAGCLRARSLLAEEAREQRDRPHTGAAYPATPTGQRCQSALSDPDFPPCASLESAFGDSRCRELLDKVCGADNRCGDGQPCDVARQLLRLETEERLVNDDPGALSVTGRQCLEALGNDFFTPCEPDSATAPTASD